MFKIYLEQVPWARRVNCYIMRESKDGKRVVAKPTILEFETVDEGTAVDPTLVFTRADGGQFLQELSNALAQAGYQVDLSSERGELKATKKHLEDMRTLALKDSK